MGLDMFAYKIIPGEGIEAGIKEELHYWRKHNALHGWMEDLYAARGGKETFNCIPLQLTMEDLDNLEYDLKNDGLTGREGFFWGNSEYPEEEKEEHKKEDLQFIADAREAIEAGWEVFYDSWW